ncbi:hypothetical protein KGF54_003300 [Candida jiufengensis]|uniref:uncharacterized protein n=1 Tax=Candida jiufengensis TaxID=497108 RepID=UPI002224CE9C|nr:uncharacterized protein KGF54_003300 [Candida jiufengensis]KAI5952433.1 hypothetical protein KGF54_003300 [Candida jiufengensis]
MFLVNYSKSFANKLIPNDIINITSNDNKINKSLTNLMQIPASFIPNPMSSKTISRRSTALSPGSSPKSSPNSNDNDNEQFKNNQDYFNNILSEDSENDELMKNNNSSNEEVSNKRIPSIKRKKSSKSKSNKNSKRNRSESVNHDMDISVGTIPNQQDISMQLKNLFGEGYTLNALEWILISIILYLLYKLYYDG